MWSMSKAKTGSGEMYSHEPTEMPNILDKSYEFNNSEDENREKIESKEIA